MIVSKLVTQPIVFARVLSSVTTNSEFVGSNILELADNSEPSHWLAESS